MLISEDYILVIDTDHYAGHFADELCAYVTGFFSEEADSETVGMSDLFYRDFGIEDDGETLAEEQNTFFGYIADHMNEEGVYSPVVVWPSRKYGVNASGEHAVLSENNYNSYNFPAGFSVGIYFSENPPKELIDIVKTRSAKFFNEIYPRVVEEGRDGQVAVEGFRLIVHRKTAEEEVI